MDDINTVNARIARLEAQRARAIEVYKLTGSEADETYVDYLEEQIIEAREEARTAGAVDCLDRAIRGLDSILADHALDDATRHNLAIVRELVRDGAGPIRQLATL